ncbi:unnamed protein product [Phyllotreta striolata]|uniref:TROVE domain-containing protein n=1 Tax=Phyllotreta striolata TaxID=444603 RepID=A0A9N9TV94_PHYSR|nr:unnamed protein product [Phyllotreta striolata]
MAASKLTNEEKLKRLIYVCNVNPKYYCGGPDKYVRVCKQRFELLQEMMKENHEELIGVMQSVNSDPLIPYRSIIYHTLAYGAVISGDAKCKNAVSRSVLGLIKSDKELFDFIMYSTKFHTQAKISKSVRKTITAFYKKKSSTELAQLYAASKSCHGWSHKDLIKLCHLKSESTTYNAVVNYILTNKIVDNNDDEAKKLIEVMRKSDTLRKTSDLKIAVPLIEELKATIHQVEPKLKKSAEVWNAALSNMSLADVLNSMPKLYKLGFLKKDSPIQSKIAELLTNSDTIKSSNVHPMEVFIHMKNFEKGGKPLDVKLLAHLIEEKKLPDEEIAKLKTANEVKCQILLGNLLKCMSISCKNVRPIGKRYLITIDTTDKMDAPCLSNKTITGIEAAAAFAWYLLRVEQSVTVAVFKEKEISLVPLERKGQLKEHIGKLREKKSKYLHLAAPFEWALTNKKHFDVFLNFVHHNEYCAGAPEGAREKIAKPMEAFQKYKQKLKEPNAKLVNFCLSSPHLDVADGSPNVLDVSGLDLGVPKLVEAFCRDNFH